MISVMQVKLCNCSLDAVTQQRERGLPLTPSNKLHPITVRRSGALSGRDQSQAAVSPNGLINWLMLCLFICLTDRYSPMQKENSLCYAELKECTDSGSVQCIRFVICIHQTQIKKNE